MEKQGYDISATRAIVPRLQSLLKTCRDLRIQVYHTREGKRLFFVSLSQSARGPDWTGSPCQMNATNFKPGHRPDLSTLSPGELTRSRNNPSGLGIGDPGPLGRLLVRGEPGHTTIPELCPLASEPIIDKPGRGAFAHTDFELLLRLKGVKNLIIAGVTTDVCVHTTMREANDRGFDCLLVEDACAASEKHLHDAAVQMVRTEGGIFGATALTADILAVMTNMMPQAE